MKFAAIRVPMPPSPLGSFSTFMDVHTGSKRESRGGGLFQCPSRGPGRGKTDIVCFCNAIERATIVDAIERGATTLEEIQEQVGATIGPCGGSCTPNVLKLIREVLEKRTPGSAPSPPEAPKPED